MTFAYRDLTSLEDLRRVAQLERAVWGMGYDDLVPASLMVVQVKCGAIVIGALAADEMVGFVYSFPGVRHGHRVQWSHMLGVLPSHRSGGVGRQLKLLQRERTLAQGLDRLEWTYDPLQAVNARFNIARLGAVVREYVPNAYGESQSPLHRGAPTDRFVAQWWLESPRVERLISDGAAGTTAGPTGVLLNPVRYEDGWWRCGGTPRLPDADVLLVSVPPDFTAMLSDAPDVALEWRSVTRPLFEEAFSSGYVVTGFEPDRSGCGRYVLTR